MLKLGFTFRFLSELQSSVMAVIAACAKSLQKVWEGMWPSLDPWAAVGPSSVWNVPKKYGPYELFFFIEKEPTTYEKVVDFERVTSSDAEDGRSFSDEEGDHNVENFLLCSFAQHACSPLLQGFLHQEELCKVALTCHFSLDVMFLCQD